MNSSDAVADKEIAIDILGSLRVVTDSNADYDFLPPKPRTVLATLLMNAGQVVPISSLVEELWGPTPPASALRVVQTYVLQVRKYFASISGLTMKRVAKQVVSTHLGGYMFQGAFARLDFTAFQRLALLGRQAHARAEYSSGISYLREAMALWRGPALVDVVRGSFLDTCQRRLDESRISALKNLAEMHLHTGCHSQALVDLASLTMEYPHHEEFHALYMRALAQSGRRAEALDVYNRLRRRLVSELGVEPGPHMQQVQHDILNSYCPSEPPPHVAV